MSELLPVCLSEQPWNLRTLHPLPSLKIWGSVPQVLKQVVNLSCYYSPEWMQMELSAEVGRYKGADPSGCRSAKFRPRPYVLSSFEGRVWRGRDRRQVQRHHCLRRASGSAWFYREWRRPENDKFKIETLFTFASLNTVRIWIQWGLEYQTCYDFEGWKLFRCWMVFQMAF